MKSRVLLIFIGILNLLFGILGFFDLLLFTGGLVLIRRPFEGRIFSIRVLLGEIAYFSLFWTASWIAPHRIADAISAGFGIGGAGLTFQFLTGYPIWALIVLWLAKDRKVTSDYSDAEIARSSSR